MINQKKNNLKLKQKLFNLCCDFVENRRNIVQTTINEIQESLTSETKSSAGDKHETGRAMLQLEREKAGRQLAEIEKLKENLAKINPDSESKIVGLGSIVYTTQANYFIAISAGQMEVDSQSFFAIAPNTPIGLLLMGKNVGDKLTFKETTFVIKAFE